MIATWWHLEESQVFKTRVRELIQFRAPWAKVLFPDNSMERERNTWNGETLAPFIDDRVGFLHDVSHILVATNSRLCKVNCGLGHDPAEERDSPACYRQVTERYADREEGFACVLQLALAAHLDCSDSQIESEASFLCTSFPSEDELASVRKYRPQALSEENWTQVEKARRAYEKRNQ